MLTQNQKDIITDLVIDNGLIFNEMKIWMAIHNPRAFERAQSVIMYCHALFMETVYDMTNDDTDYIEMRLTELLATIAKYRMKYGVGTRCYTVFNSLFDKTVEAFSEFNETI